MAGTRQAEDPDASIDDLRRRVRDLEQRLEESERRLHQAVGTAERTRAGQGQAAALLEGIVAALHQACILAIDRDGRYLFVWTDPALEKRYGFRGQDLLGKTIHEVFPPEMAEERIAFTRRVMDSGARFREEYAFTTPNGTFWHDASVAPLRDADGDATAAIGIVLDITDRKRAEAEHERMRERLRQADKQESLGMMAAGVAHDFNNLIMGIQGNASLLGEELEPGSPASIRARTIEKNAAYASELIQKLLAFAGDGTLDVQEIDMGRLFEQVAALVRPGLPAGVDLAVENEVPPGGFRADPLLLQQALVNLLDNAIEASRGAGGVVRLSARTIRADRQTLDDALLGHDLSEGDYLDISVADAGAGMDERILDRAFDPFFSTKRSGRGLGLPTVLGIIRRHRGAIHADSLPGSGTTFRLLLPAGR